MSYREEIARVFKKEGLLGFTDGYRAMVVRDIISFGFYFLIYENVKGREDPPFWWRMISGATAGMFSWALGFPFDSLKLRMQAGIVDPKLSLYMALA